MHCAKQGMKIEITTLAAREKKKRIQHVIRTTGTGRRVRRPGVKDRANLSLKLNLASAYRAERA